jgi:hypothetical protein
LIAGYIVVLQVLEVLADPNAPTQLLAAKLRFVAAAVGRQQRQEFAEWLDDGLFTHLLDLLRRLPDMGLDDDEAAEICAAAAAGVSNTIQHATVFSAAEQLQDFVPPPDSLRKDATCVEVLRSLVRYGLVNPAATEQLPPGQLVQMTPTQGGVPADVFVQTSCGNNRTDREFWTPWRICAVTVFDRLLTGGFLVTSAMAAELAPAVTTTIFQQLLTSTIKGPCGEICCYFVLHAE